MQKRAAELINSSWIIFLFAQENRLRTLTQNKRNAKETEVFNPCGKLFEKMYCYLKGIVPIADICVISCSMVIIITKINCGGTNGGINSFVYKIYLFKSID